MIDETSRRAFSAFAFTLSALLLFWWPLSHWIYSDWWHRLLGFAAGSYPAGMVRSIGTSGLLPVFLMAYIGLSPEGKRPLIIALSLFSLALAITYLVNILTGSFPKGEWLNLALCAAVAALLPISYARLVEGTRGRDGSAKPAP